jgi:hypothetical protein
VRIAAFLVLAATVSCSSLFGLEVPPNADRDADNRRDAEDNCPRAANPDQSDKDGDGIGDACDECLDGGEEDADMDGILDGCDGCIGINVDADNDGIDDGCDMCIGDGTNVGDADGDGIDDGCDTCIALGIDSDGDGLDDECDPCDAGPQHDEDGDGVMDACDNCPAIANPGQEMTTPPIIGMDYLGDACDPEQGIGNTELFDPFTTAIPSWYQQGANWSVENDTLRFLGGETSYRLLGQGNALFTVRTTVTFESFAFFGNGAISVLASAGQPQPPATGVECRIQLTSATAGEVVLRTYSNGTFVDVPAGSDIDLSQPFTLELVVDLETSEALCRGATRNKFVQTTIDFKEKMFFTGVSATGRSVHFDYFDLITR